MSGSLIIEDAQLVFRNFAGKEGKYNAEGDRNFCVILDEDAAEQMVRDGWNIKALRSREEGDPEKPYVQVSVGFKFRPPKLVMVTSKGRTDLTEEELELFDFVESKHPQALAALREKRELTNDVKAQLNAVLEEFKGRFAA